MRDNIRRIDNDETQQMYNDLQRVAREIDFDSPSYTDEEWLKTSLGAIFVTNPIDKGEPFEVTRRVPCREHDGKDFSVDSLKMTPKDTMAGGYYKLHFYALSPRNRYYYEFKGDIHQYSPNLRIEYSYIDEVPRSGLESRL